MSTRIVVASSSVHPQSVDRVSARRNEPDEAYWLVAPTGDDSVGSAAGGGGAAVTLVGPTASVEDAMAARMTPADKTSERGVAALRELLLCGGTCPCNQPVDAITRRASQTTLPASPRRRPLT
jgi:hypothetical protein